MADLKLCESAYWKKSPLPGRLVEGLRLTIMSRGYGREQLRDMRARSCVHTPTHLMLFDACLCARASWTCACVNDGGQG